ncbi:hypothetical protein GCM10022406_30690 [Hymenobacter algoricola]|uniref:Nucleotidyltransferase family protein n=2 Tax=Hymenobacter algoricola TaxID=486267 RepID=A0ABP7NGU4_9BACT
MLFIGLPKRRRKDWRRWNTCGRTPSGFTTVTTLANSLDQDYKELIELLNAHEVRYLVVGGCAVAYHGSVRYSVDIDVWVEVAPENAARLVRVTRDSGFGSLYKEAYFLEPGGIIQLGVAPVLRLMHAARISAQRKKPRAYFQSENAGLPTGTTQQSEKEAARGLASSLCKRTK